MYTVDLGERLGFFDAALHGHHFGVLGLFFGAE
jgi:hypothetical protein